MLICFLFLRILSNANREGSIQEVDSKRSLKIKITILTFTVVPPEKKYRKALPFLMTKLSLLKALCDNVTKSSQN